MKTFYYILLYFIFSQTVKAQEVDTTMWVTDGSVHAIARNENTIFLGGKFSFVGPNTGSGVLLNDTEGSFAEEKQAYIKGSVNISVSDGKGGWYIGGEFTTVEKVNRKGLAHINSDGSLDRTWNPILNGNVNTIAISNNNIYIGGSFTLVAGQTRNKLAAIDATTGQITAWNPIVNGEVKVITISNNMVYVGGTFTSVSGQTRNRLAAIDATTGQVNAWNPNVNGGINTIAISNNNIYIGGSFTLVAGQTRNKLAAIDATTGQVTAWNPNSVGGNGGEIRTIAISNNTIYVGGFIYYFIGGQPRDYLTAIDATTGLTTSWNPKVRGLINTIVISNSIIYIGGSFTSVGGQPRSGLAAIDATSGLATSWNTNVGVGWVNTIAISNNKVYVGGTFTSAGGQLRNNLAALDAITGQATAWNPPMDNGVYSLGISKLVAFKNTVYVQGDFGAIGGQARSGLAALDATTGQATSWNPTRDKGIRSISLFNGKLYLTGVFTSIDGQARNGLAALDATTGQVTAWNPDIRGYESNGILTTAVSNNIVFIGGTFTSVGGQARSGLAALDATTGQVTSWNPNTIGGDYSEVRTMAVSNNIVFIGGTFTSVGGQARNGLAAIDATTGQVTSWNPPNIVGGYYTFSIATSNNTLFVGGGVSGNTLDKIDITTGIRIPWNLAFQGVNQYNPPIINTLLVYDDIVYVGGMFKSIQNRLISNFAAFGKKFPKNPNLIQGNIFNDTNGDCKKDTEEKGIRSRIVVTEPDNYYGITDSLGNYSLAVDTGTYTIKQIIPAEQEVFTQQTCPTNPATHRITFKSYNNTIIGKDFSNQVIAKPYLSISVSSDRRRRCFPGNTIINYCNLGSATATNVKVYLQLPEHVVLGSADFNYSIDQNKNYVFTLNELPANECGSISIVDSVVCDNPDIRDLTQCTKVWITPDNNTTPSPDWDKSDITLKARCAENGLVKLSIHNTGTGHMADSSSFRIYLDASPVFQHKFKLNAGDSLSLQVPANGQTLRLEADQRPFHPTKEQNSITIEACGVNSEGKVSTGFVAQLPQDDEEPEVAIECLPIIDSFDPNDKLVLPAGVTANHYTPTNKALDYTIRFQNTGSDYAYKVVVIDTLSEYLDMSTFQMGATSHAYKLNVTGKGRPILTFTFDNINLPDSTRDQLGSNGFIKFSIKPLAGIAEKTVIENYADIFFDFNEPVRTNTVFNAIYDVPATPVNNEKVIICQTNAVSFAGINRSFCEQDTLYLQANAPAAGKGKWKLIKGTASIQNLTNPSSLITNLAYGENIFEWKVPANSCSTDSTSSTVTIHRKPAPGTPVITQKGTDSLFCNISGTSYEWYLSETKLDETGQHIQVSESGNYTVKITLDGCSSPLSQVFSYQKIPTGLEQYAAQIKVYPNPATSSLFVELPANWQVTVTLSDAMGRVVKESIPTRGQPRIELSITGVKAGMYMLHITTKHGTIVKKLMVR